VSQADDDVADDDVADDDVADDDVADDDVPNALVDVGTDCKPRLNDRPASRCKRIECTAFCTYLVDVEWF
jgi:hypothetical protein